MFGQVPSVVVAGEKVLEMVVRSANGLLRCQQAIALNEKLSSLSMPVCPSVCLSTCLSVPQPVCWMMLCERSVLDDATYASRFEHGLTVQPRSETLSLFALVSPLRE